MISRYAVNILKIYVTLKKIFLSQLQVTLQFDENVNLCSVLEKMIKQVQAVEKKLFRKIF